MKSTDKYWKVVTSSEYSILFMTCHYFSLLLTIQNHNGKYWKYWKVLKSIEKYWILNTFHYVSLLFTTFHYFSILSMTHESKIIIISTGALMILWFYDPINRKSQIRKYSTTQPSSKIIIMSEKYWEIQKNIQNKN